MTSALTPTLSPGRGNSFRLFLVMRMSVRPIRSHKYSNGRRTILPLLGERVGVRADVILASMMSSAVLEAGAPAFA
jgi:hypothetical protein